jgi:UDP-N-acetylmuramoyl-L-alanyl-D-glutamate--2,6-diaminopimelate ligase
LTSLTEDSRVATTGALFAAMVGSRADGRAFAADAAAKGAAAILWPTAEGGPNPSEMAIPILTAPLKGFRAVVARAAREIYGRPDERLPVVGLTGTNGKSTISYLLEAMALKDAKKPGVMGTVDYRWPGASEPAPNTTPEGPLLYATLARMLEAGCDLAVLEISSHALDLGRVDSLKVAAALFTNLTRDHLDHHGSMEAYFEAKRKLFLVNLQPGGRAAVGIDDPWGERLAFDLGGRALTYGLAPEAHVRPLELALSRDGAAMLVAAPEGPLEIRTSLLGTFNVQNALGAIALARILGLSDAAIISGLAGCPGAPGRLQRVGGEHLALIDYAHTPSALAAALESLRALRPERLIVVFGCGGDRDKGKRPLMGREAGRLSDLAILTSDNPRTEDPLAIIESAAEGLRDLGLREVKVPDAGGGPGSRPGSQTGSPTPEDLRGAFVIEPDRRRAIGLAARLMNRDDLLLVAGKGHEDYQILGREKIRFDDAEETLKALIAAGKGPRT